MRRICEVADIHPETLYQRIDFSYRQCKVFVANREQALLDGMKVARLYIAVDRQDYTVNWSNQHDKRNVIMHSVGSADHGSGYVFGMHLDFDPTIDPAHVEADASAQNDHAISYPFRRYARLWLKSDYTDYIHQRRRMKKRIDRMKDVSSEIAETYAPCLNDWMWKRHSHKHSTLRYHPKGCRCILNIHSTVISSISNACLVELKNYDSSSIRNLASVPRACLLFAMK